MEPTKQFFILTYQSQVNQRPKSDAWFEHSVTVISHRAAKEHKAKAKANSAMNYRKFEVHRYKLEKSSKI